MQAIFGSRSLLSRSLCLPSTSYCSPTVTTRLCAVSTRSKEALIRPIIPVPIKVITISRGSGSDIAKEYEKQIKNYTSFSTTILKPNPKGSSDPIQQKEAEGEKVMKLLTARDYVVILDERGRECTSEDFTDVLEAAGNRGASNLVFLIGGPFGHAPPIFQRADDSIRLSRMVMNHAVAHAVLVEQIYRAWTITKGQPYHH